MYVLGVDEAGRGPIAGPVSVGVIAVTEGFDLLSVFPGLNDSKKLSEKKREALFTLLQEEIRKGTVRAHVTLVSAARIDREGIAPCIRRGVEKGVRALLPTPSEGHILLDGSLHTPKGYTGTTIIDGDAIEPAIMLASIAAKVTRDRKMRNLNETYPQYGFDAHKGYGTKAHYAAVKEHGRCPQHRRTFLKGIEV